MGVFDASRLNPAACAREVSPLAQRRPTRQTPAQDSPTVVILKPDDTKRGIFLAKKIANVFQQNGRPIPEHVNYADLFISVTTHTMRPSLNDMQPQHTAPKDGSTPILVYVTQFHLPVLLKIR